MLPNQIMQQIEKYDRSSIKDSKFTVKYVDNIFNSLNYESEVSVFTDLEIPRDNHYNVKLV